MRILVIESDKQRKDRLENVFELLINKRYQMDIAESLKDARYYLGIRNYDLVVSNWVLEDAKGEDIISFVREKFSKIPVIVLPSAIGMSEEASEKEEIEALNSGADDYLVQSASDIIVVARIEARLRSWGSNVIEIEDLVINPDEEKIIFKGEEIEVKGKPFEVLTHLAKHRDQIISKDQLLDAIWEEPELVTPNVIEVAINQIRQKMDKPLGITTIETIRRRGYRFCYPGALGEE